jgi:hypothetical protein
MPLENSATFGLSWGNMARRGGVKGAMCLGFSTSPEKANHDTSLSGIGSVMRVYVAFILPVDLFYRGRLGLETRPVTHPCFFVIRRPPARHWSRNSYFVKPYKRNRNTGYRKQPYELRREPLSEL